MFGCDSREKIIECEVVACGFERIGNHSTASEVRLLANKYKMLAKVDTVVHSGVVIVMLSVLLACCL